MRDDTVIGRARRYCKGLGEFTLKDVMEGLGLSRPAADAVLSEMLRAGDIEHADKLRGAWVLVRWVPEERRAQAAAAWAKFLAENKGAASTPPPAAAPASASGAAPGKKRRRMTLDASDPKVRYWAGVSGMLWWAAAVLGVACMLDTLHQACTYNLWHPFWPLYYLYYPVVTAYAGARDKEKRVRRAEAREKYTGEFFVIGWGGILIFIWAFNSMHYAVAYPPTLTQTLAVIGGIYLGVKFGVPALWPMPPAWEDVPDAPPQPGQGPTPLPGPTPAPLPGPGPTPNPAPPNPDTNDGPEGNGRSSSGPILLAAYKNLGVFSIEDVEQATGLTLPVIKGHLGQMVRWGHVQKEPGGKFRWLG